MTDIPTPPAGRRARVLYVRRDWSHKGLGTHVRRNVLRRLYGQDGFFEASLARAFRVTWTTADAVLRAPGRLARFDAVVVNSRQRAGLDLAELSRTVARHARGPTALLVTTARAGDVPDDAVLDPYDRVFKREPFRDRARYALSEANRAKIRATMLSCPLLKTSAGRDGRIAERLLRRYGTPREPEHDVFFAGFLSNPARFELWSRVVAAGFDHVGGLRTHDGHTAADHPAYGPEYARPRFVDTARRSRVNLALEGVGEFTYRHLELWCAGAFVLSPPSIRELELPIAPVEGEHFACFETPDDLVDHIRSWLARDEERRRIARAGLEMLVRDYDFDRHGRDIARALDDG